MIKKNKRKKSIDARISLGIDYSYEEPGFCVSTKNAQGEEIVLHVSCLNFKKLQEKGKERDKTFTITKDMKRELIDLHIKRLYQKYKFTIIVVERIRTFSHGHLSVPAIIAFAELILTIINATKNIDKKIKRIPVYSVDTRSWKKRMNGSAKAQKADTIKWAMQFMTIELMQKRDFRELTDNEADAIAQSMVARHADAEIILEEEE